jgi:OOP family OmpA-OmpF porin
MRRIGLIIGLAAVMAGPAFAQEVSIPPAIAYFSFEDAALTERAEASLDQFVEAFRVTGQTAVAVSGHTDRGEENVDALSYQRAVAVRDYLVSQGIPEAAISTTAYGEDRPAIDTEDGVREPDNRRVEVTAGPGSGW